MRVLDQGVKLGRRYQLSVAQGPVGTAEAGVGYPDDAAKGDLADRGYQGERGDDEEAPAGTARFPGWPLTHERHLKPVARRLCKASQS